MDKQSIIFLLIGDFEKELLDDIAISVENEYKYPVIIQEKVCNLNLYYDGVRRQYDGNKLLQCVEMHNPRYCIKKIGLFEVDLFIPILTYIFGQSIYKGSSGIASLYRLKNEQYGMKPDLNLAYERFKKVIIHEIGHMFGLVHCYFPTCVMRSGTYVEDIDQKEQHICRNCRSIISASI